MICPECKKDINKDKTEILVLPSGGWQEKGYCSTCGIVITNEYKPDGKLFKARIKKIKEN